MFLLSWKFSFKLFPFLNGFSYRSQISLKLKTFKFSFILYSEVFVEHEKSWKKTMKKHFNLVLIAFFLKPG